MLGVLERSPLYSHVTVEEKDAGSHFLLHLDTPLSDTELKWLARENGVRLDCLSEYYAKDRAQRAHTIIVNYSGLAETDFQKALEVLLLAVNE